MNPEQNKILDYFKTNALCINNAISISKLATAI